jgi:hypothetical protein
VSVSPFLEFSVFNFSFQNRGDTLGNLFIASAKRIFLISAGDNLVTTYVGDPNTGSTAENVAATSASITSAVRITGDSLGNVYYIDNCRIRKVTAGSKLVSTVVGSTSCGATGENTVALSTQFNSPNALWLDTSGNLIIGDYYNYKIRKWTVSTGRVNTIAGTGTEGFSDNLPATSAMFYSVYDIIGDTNGNIYFSDWYNNQVRKITSSGILVTYAGDGGCCSFTENSLATSSHIDSPTGLQLDSSGKLYISLYNKIAVVDPSTTLITTVIGGCAGYSGDGGPATSACIYTANSIWITTNFQFYLAQSAYYRIRKVASNIITLFAGTGYFAFTGDGGSAKSAQLYEPSGTFVDTNGNVYIADTKNCHIRLVNTAGIISSIGGNTFCQSTGDNGPFSQASLAYPIGIWEDTIGNLYISEKSRVRKVSASNNIITTVAGGGSSTTDNIAATSYSFSSLYGIWGDTVNNIFVADCYRHNVKKLSLSSSLLITVAGSGVSGFVDNVPATSGKLYYPDGIWVDELGRLFIADEYNHRIRKVENGIISTFAGTGTTGFNGDGRVATATSLYHPYGVIGDLNGNIYVADSYNKRIRMIYAVNNTANVVTTVAGTGSSSISKGVLLATDASLSYPEFVTVDTNGNLYITEDESAHTIRKTVLAVSPTSQPSRQPTGQPTNQPTRQPFARPTAQPSRQPTTKPSGQPTQQPFGRPSAQPSSQPSGQPTGQPSRQPFSLPSAQPSSDPTGQPSGQPTQQPFGTPTAQPSAQPSRQPSRQPICSPTSQPSTQPSTKPSGQPSGRPSSQPTGRPTGQPTCKPSAQPSRRPTQQPSQQPTAKPSGQPTRQPTGQPSMKPSTRPSSQPSCKPSTKPTQQPTAKPSMIPSEQPSTTPSSQPSVNPTRQPTSQPTDKPSDRPSSQPSTRPTEQPTNQPSGKPSSQPLSQPSSQPTKQPTVRPSDQPSGQPSAEPRSRPSSQPSRRPTDQPSSRPTKQPTGQPSGRPSDQPSSQPSRRPTNRPTDQPTIKPSSQPTSQPSVVPSSQPTSRPTVQPSSCPSGKPSTQPSNRPTLQPTEQPSGRPTIQPSSQPSRIPSCQPSSEPSGIPSPIPSGCPSDQPTSVPSSLPSGQPTSLPSNQPSSFPTNRPTCVPTSQPSGFPSSLPSSQPSVQPTSCPTAFPSSTPTFQPTIHIGSELKEAIAGFYDIKDSLNDKSGNGNNGIAHGGIRFTADRFGSEKSSIEFDGNSGYIEVPTKNPDLLITNFTISFWIYPNISQLIPGTVVFDKSAYLSETCGWSLIYFTTHLFEFSYSVKQSGRRLTDSSNFSSNLLFDIQGSDWSHITLVKELQTLLAYRNGHLVNSTNIPLSVSLPYSSLPLVIGTSKEILFPSENVNTTNFYSGGLDDIFIYDRALSAAEITQLKEFSAPTSFPSAQPSTTPSIQPSSVPTINPSGQPTAGPSRVPTNQPTSCPTGNPTNQPTCQPSGQPTFRPSSQPIGLPTSQPSTQPSSYPTSCPTTLPSGKPSSCPSSFPSTDPTPQPSDRPSQQPIGRPSSVPSAQPLSTPTMIPSVQPSSRPTNQPTSFPSTQPSSQPTKNRFHCTATDNKFYSSIRDDCVPCPLHSFLNHTGDDTCYCSGGYSQVGLGLTVNCTVCSAGEVSFPGSSNCTQCQSGFFANAETNRCELCPVSFYSRDSGQTQCTPCPAGRATATLGSTSIDQCISPIPNFTLGFLALFLVVVIFSWYIVFGKFQRVSFERKTKIVTPNIEECKKVLLSEEEFHYQHLIDVQDKKDKQTVPFKFSSFVVLSVILMIGSVFLGFVFFTYQVFFTSLILWRGLQADLNLSPILTLIAEGLKDITEYISMPVDLFYFVALPFLYLFEALASIDLNLSSVNVTCAGSQAPIELLINCFILGLLVIIIRSDYQLLFNVLLNKLNQRILLNNVEQRLDAGNFRFSRYFFICLAISALNSINPFQVGLRYCMGFVRIYTFGKNHGLAHEITESCDQVPGAPYFDSFLGYFSTIFAWWLILPAVYCLAEVVVPKCKEIDKEMKSRSEEKRYQKSGSKIFPADPLVDESVKRSPSRKPSVAQNDQNAEKFESCDSDSNSEEEEEEEVEDRADQDFHPPDLPSHLCSKFPEVDQRSLSQVYREAFQDGVNKNRLKDSGKHSTALSSRPSIFLNSVQKVTKKMPFILAFYYYCKEKYFLMISVDLWVSNFFSSWINLLKKNSLKTDEKEEPKQDMHLYDSDHRKKQRELDFQWEKERHRNNHRLPPYYELCLEVRDELHDSILEPFAGLIAFFGPAHFFTPTGRYYWMIALNNYKIFLCVCLGIWTDEAVKAYELEDTTVNLTVACDLQQYEAKKLHHNMENHELLPAKYTVSHPAASRRQILGFSFTHGVSQLRQGRSESERQNMQEVLPVIISVLICSRVILFQVVPSLVLFATISMTLASFPLFIFNDFLYKTLPPLIIYGQTNKDMAIERELKSFVAIHPETKEIRSKEDTIEELENHYSWRLTVRGTVLFWNESRLLQFIQSSLTLFFSFLLLIYTRDLLVYLMVILGILLFFILTKSLVLLLYLGSSINLKDADFPVWLQGCRKPKQQQQQQQDHPAAAARDDADEEKIVPSHEETEVRVFDVEQQIEDLEVPISFRSSRKPEQQQRQLYRSASLIPNDTDEEKVRDEMEIRVFDIEEQINENEKNYISISFRSSRKPEQKQQQLHRSASAIPDDTEEEKARDEMEVRVFDIEEQMNETDTDDFPVSFRSSRKPEQQQQQLHRSACVIPEATDEEKVREETEVRAFEAGQTEEDKIDDCPVSFRSSRKPEQQRQHSASVIINDTEEEKVLEEAEDLIFDIEQQIEETEKGDLPVSFRNSRKPEQQQEEQQQQLHRSVSLIPNDTDEEKVRDEMEVRVFDIEEQIDENEENDISISFRSSRKPGQQQQQLHSSASVIPDDTEEEKVHDEEKVREETEVRVFEAEDDKKDDCPVSFPRTRKPEQQQEQQQQLHRSASVIPNPTDEEKVREETKVMIFEVERQIEEDETHYFPNSFRRSMKSEQHHQQKQHHSVALVPNEMDDENILPVCRTPSSTHEIEEAEQEIERDTMNDDNKNNSINATEFAGHDIEMNNIESDQYPASSNGSDSLIVHPNLEECDELC